MVAKGEWSDYEKGKKKKEYGEFVRKAREFIFARDSPWQANPDNMGQPVKNDPTAIAICLLLKTRLCLPYRDLVSFLEKFKLSVADHRIEATSWKDGSPESNEPPNKGVSIRAQLIHRGRRLL
jgi:hypothetical protein